MLHGAGGLPFDLVRDVHQLSSVNIESSGMLKATPDSLRVFSVYQNSRELKQQFFCLKSRALPLRKQDISLERVGMSAHLNKVPRRHDGHPTHRRCSGRVLWLAAEGPACAWFRAQGLGSWQINTRPGSEQWIQGLPLKLIPVAM